MTNDERRRTTEVPAGWCEPVGEPVIRGDPAVTGDRVREAVDFDPIDPGSLAEAVRTVRSSSESTTDDSNHVFMLRGAATCAALVRGVGSYKRAAERVGGDVSVSFIRKWARVHNLPQSVHRHVARGRIAPTAVKYIVRTPGDARLHLAWATLDAGLTVHEVRRLASEVNDGTPAVDAPADHGADTGRLDVTLPADVYLEFRRRASLEDMPSGDAVAGTLDDYLN